MIFSIKKRAEAIELIDFYFAKDKKIKIETVKGIRSLNQNSYLHGVVFSIYAIHLGWTIDEVKQHWKKKFLSYQKDGEVFVKETKKLDTKEMEIFLENCRVNAMLEEKCYIPKPREVTDEMLEEIIRHEKYIK